MTKETFSNFLKAYKALNSPIYELQIPKTYGENFEGPYTGYESTYFETRGVFLEVLKKIEKLTLEYLYQRSYLIQENLPGNYVNAPAVVFKERAFGLHYEVRNILFFSMFQHCEDDILKLINLFEDKDFHYQFAPYLKNQNDFIEINNNYSKQLLERFKEILKEPEKTISILLAGYLLEVDGFKWIFHRKTILKLLSYLNEKYNRIALVIE